MYWNLKHINVVIKASDTVTEEEGNQILMLSPKSAIFY